MHLHPLGSVFFVKSHVHCSCAERVVEVCLAWEMFDFAERILVDQDRVVVDVSSAVRSLFADFQHFRFRIRIDRSQRSL